MQLEVGKLLEAPSALFLWSYRVESTRWKLQHQFFFSTTFNIRIRRKKSQRMPNKSTKVRILKTLLIK